MADNNLLNFPLFPLGQLLMPGQRVSLQIFEPRYLDMIKVRMRQEATFGVVQIRDGREVGQAPLFFPVGTEAVIVDFDQMPNGLLGLEIEGRQRLRVLRSEVQVDQLLLAEVEWLLPEPELALNEQYDGLLQLLEELRKHPVLNTLRLPEVADLSQLGWQLGWLLPISMPEKMALWELQDPEERLEQLAIHVSRLSRQ